MEGNTAQAVPVFNNKPLRIFYPAFNDCEMQKKVHDNTTIEIIQDGELTVLEFLEQLASAEKVS